MATVHRMQTRRGSRFLLWLVLVVAIVVAVHVWIDRLYALRLHVALGYGGVYSKQMVFELLTRYLGALLYAVLGWLAVRGLRSILHPALYPVIRGAFIFVGWLLGYSLWALDPTPWFLFFKHVPFGHVDPSLHMDDAFYVYLLPLLTGVLGRVIFTIILWVGVRFVHFIATYVRQHLLNGAKLTQGEIYKDLRRLLLWSATLFLTFAIAAWLNRFDTVLTSGNGDFIFGPDFTTSKLTLPVFSWLRILAFLLIAVSLISTGLRAPKLFPLRDGFVSFSRSSFRQPLQAAGVFVVVAILAPIATGLVSSLYVHPNQNTVELPYIQRTIDATRWALGIENVRTQPFNPKNQLTSAGVNRDANALQNVRVNDQNQTTSIYNQLQSFKSYFQFTNTSVDRYGSSEVYVSARQMNVNNLPVQTWVNQTLVYTHGYGLAVSPVNQFDQDGLPILWAQNTPQQTQPPLPKITRPEIYFGTMGNDVIAPSKQGEFEYPSGSTDVTSHYNGGYALPIQGNRLLLAIEQGTLRFYTSDQILPQSQWLFDRNIYQRVEDIAPFLTYDHDAFPFIDEKGHIEWMLDAYTSTPNVPYAQSYMNTAYIRNSVKVVMDAYTGKVTFYAIDPNDAMLQSLAQVYPGLFTYKVPADIAAHFRYPTDLFQAQAQALTRYHMTEASAFYNQEDLWDMANQIYQQNEVQARPPVYQMIRMPNQTAPQFVLSSLFTPHQKDNLNGWLVADNGPIHYGQLTLYQFPQSHVIFGPMQAENQIDANPAISQQLTLWNQQGSQVVRGDLLLVPVGDTILYVEPVYLVATRQNSLPQLQRVIIDFNQQVYIDTSLGAAIQDLLNDEQAGSTPAQNVPSGTGGAGGAGGAGGSQAGGAGGGAGAGTGAGTAGGSGNLAGQSQTALITQANQLFTQYQQDTAKGDLAAAGKDLQQLGTVLQALRGLGGTGNGAVGAGVGVGGAGAGTGGTSGIGVGNTANAVGTNGSNATASTQG